MAQINYPTPAPEGRNNLASGVSHWTLSHDSPSPGGATYKGYSIVESHD